MADQPGRTCPVHYRTSATHLRVAPVVEAQTLYVIGGLYGNHEALKAILALADAETQAGLPAPTLVFNGDFLWFNAGLQQFTQVAETVLDHVAIAGNVEIELVTPSPGAGCGCAYPDWVDDATVEHSNRIMRRLQSTAREAPDIIRTLAGLDRQLRARVGDLRVAILHGDPDAVAGWGLALENMPETGTTSQPLNAWFEEAGVDVLACTHTCTAFMQDIPGPGRRLVVNNGAAGMPNFRHDRRGLITRIGLQPAPTGRIYGTTLRGVHCDALAVAWDTQAWDAWFTRHWPPGSPAAESYARRMAEGPVHEPKHACRLSAPDLRDTR